MPACPTIGRMLCGLLLFLRALTFSFAQTTEQQKQDAPQTAQSPAALLTVTVTGHDHKLVTDLKAENFAVLEGGQPRTVLSAAIADAPACIGLLVDSSGSMRGKSGAVASAVAVFARSGNRENQYFAVNFNDTAYLDQDFTRDPALIEKALARADPRGGTALYDTLSAAADHLAENTECKKRVLVLISDGGDNASRVTRQKLIDTLRSAGNPLVYSMVLPEVFGQSHPAARKGVEGLASASGGEAFDLHSLKDLAPALARLGEELRSQYVVTYASPNPAGRQSDVKVMVRNVADKKLAAKVNVSGTERPKLAGGPQQ